MEAALIAFMLTDTSVSASAGTRLHWGARTQGEVLPGMVFTRTGGRRDANFQGVNGLVESRVQIACMASTYTAAKNLATAAVARVAGIAGYVNGTTFQGSFINSERDDFDGEAPDRIYRTSVDVTLWHDE